MNFFPNEYVIHSDTGWRPPSSNGQVHPPAHAEPVVPALQRTERPAVQFKSRHTGARSDGWNGHTYAYTFVDARRVPSDLRAIGQAVVSAAADSLHVNYPKIRWYRPAHPGERGDFHETKAVHGLYDVADADTVLLDCTLTELETVATAGHEVQHYADHKRHRPMTEVAAESLGNRLRAAFAKVWE